MNYTNKYLKRKILLIQEKSEYVQQTKRKSNNRGSRLSSIKNHKVILGKEKEEDTEHEKEIKDKAMQLYKTGNYKTFKEAKDAARQEQNRKEGK